MAANVQLQADVVDEQEGTVLLRLKTGFGDPVVRVARELVKTFPPCGCKNPAPEGTYCAICDPALTASQARVEELSAAFGRSEDEVLRLIRAMNEAKDRAEKAEAERDSLRQKLAEAEKALLDKCATAEALAEDLHRAEADLANMREELAQANAQCASMRLTRNMAIDSGNELDRKLKAAESRLAALAGVVEAAKSVLIILPRSSYLWRAIVRPFKTGRMHLDLTVVPKVLMEMLRAGLKLRRALASLPAYVSERDEAIREFAYAHWDGHGKVECQTCVFLRKISPDLPAQESVKPADCRTCGGCPDGGHYDGCGGDKPVPRESCEQCGRRYPAEPGSCQMCSPSENKTTPRESGKEGK